MKRINKKPMRVLLVAGTAFASLMLTACSFGFDIGGSNTQTTTPGSVPIITSPLPSIPSTTVPPLIEVKSITLRTNKDILSIGEKAELSTLCSPANIPSLDVSYQIVQGDAFATLSGSTLTAIANGKVVIKATYDKISSQELTITVEDILQDPYLNVSSTSFYNDYKEATSSDDAKYRTQHNFMSGSIEEQVQEPTISSSQPKEGDKFLRNNTSYFSDDKETYFIVDSDGAIVDRVYRSGAYVGLDEVAAYIYAFGDVPPNYTASKNTRPSSSPWKKYLRVNNTLFSGDVSKYPYEPALPRISGIKGGDLDYYETDIGTTGTDCDPDYDISPYNNGSSIVRGAARIVYVRKHVDGSTISNLNERHVFYTFNHYNDFQEYLNYQNGWGKMFGNITGGGKLSSKTDYNPTAYEDISFQDFSLLTKEAQKLLKHLATWKDEFIFALI